MNISDPIETDSEGNSLTFLDIICEEEAFAENLDLKINSKKLYEFLEKFPEREKKILIMRYGLYNSKAYTQREISKKLGISRSYVSRIESRAIKRMNEYFMKSTER